MTCALIFASKFFKIPEIKKSQMSSPQLAASIGKERRDAAAASRAVMTHPFKLPQFQPKIVRGKKLSPVILGSPVEELMLQECKKFIRWIKINNCTNQRNSGYVTKCDCRKNIREEDTRDRAMQMVNYFSMSKRGRDVKIRDRVKKRGWRRKTPDSKSWAMVENVVK